MKTVLVVNHDQMGHGDASLGRKLLSAYLGRMNRDSGLESIVLYNAGVKLATTDSPLGACLHQLQEGGVDVLPCGTCVDHYGIKDRMVLDRVSNMDEIVATLQAADKVITL